MALELRVFGWGGWGGIGVLELRVCSWGMNSGPLALQC